MLVTAYRLILPHCDDRLLEVVTLVAADLELLGKHSIQLEQVLERLRRVRVAWVSKPKWRNSPKTFVMSGTSTSGWC